MPGFSNRDPRAGSVSITRQLARKCRLSGPALGLPNQNLHFNKILFPSRVVFPWKFEKRRFRACQSRGQSGSIFKTPFTFGFLILKHDMELKSSEGSFMSSQESCKSQIECYFPDGKTCHSPLMRSGVRSYRPVKKNSSLQSRLPWSGTGQSPWVSVGLVSPMDCEIFRTLPGCRVSISSLSVCVL